MIQKLFEHFPYLEVITRHAYKKLLEIGILKKRIVPNEKAEDVKKVDPIELTYMLEDVGVKKGDVLIVHSSMKGIKGFGMSPQEVIDYLKSLVGTEGMLLMPTYPDYPSENSKYIFNEKYNEIYEYDVEQSPAWTGLITNIFRKQEGVIRSSYPNNTLSAWGKDNSKPFLSEMETDLAYDRSSAWIYCVDNHAKVLFLGIHAHHSLSEIHIAEDYLDKDWPVTGWYTEKQYIIKNNGNTIEKTCRVRKNFWTKYMTEYYGCYRLRKKGVLIEGKIDNINYSIVPDLFEFEQYVEECAQKGDLLYFRIPRKYKKDIKRERTV